MKPKVFPDTNILLDLLLERPGFEDAAEILQAGGRENRSVLFFSYHGKCRLHSQKEHYARQACPDIDANTIVDQRFADGCGATGRSVLDCRPRL